MESHKASPSAAVGNTTCEQPGSQPNKVHHPRDETRSPPTSAEAKARLSFTAVPPLTLPPLLDTDSGLCLTQSVSIPTVDFPAMIPTMTAMVGQEVEDDNHVTTLDMCKAFFSVFIPTTISLIFLFIGQTITMIFVGHRLGFLKLAQFSVGLSIFNILGAATGWSFSGNLDTLATQAIGRDPKQRSGELTFLFQQSVVFFCIFIVPISGLFFTIEPALASIYGPDLAVGAATFLRASPPYLLLMWISNFINRLLAAQSLAELSFASNIAGAIASFVFSEYLIKENSSVTDPVLVLFISQFIILIVLCCSAWYHPKALLFPRRKVLPNSGMESEQKQVKKGDYADVNLDSPQEGIGKTRNEEEDDEEVTDTSARFALFFQPVFFERLRQPKQWTQFLIIGFYSCVSGVAAWWGFEALTLVVAQLGNEAEIAGFTVILNVLQLSFCIAEGNAVATSTCVGNALGGNKPHLAVRYRNLGMKVGVGIVSIVSSSIGVFGPQIYALYTTDKTVLAVIQPLSWIHAIWDLLDVPQVFFAHGIYRAAGKQDECLRIIISTLWLIGLPCAAIFGLWGGGPLHIEPGLGPIIVGQGLGVLVMDLLLAHRSRGWDFEQIALGAQTLHTTDDSAPQLPLPQAAITMSAIVPAAVITMFETADAHQNATKE